MRAGWMQGGAGLALPFVVDSIFVKRRDKKQ
jgi:hypothetical protein